MQNTVWYKGNNSKDWTSKDYPGWSIIDVYDEPPGHEVHKDGEAVLENGKPVRTTMFSESVHYIVTHTGGE